eukprot:CAMPEP_0194423948 /NCGR_PEP_ID=MMETSP0176-20130528/23211_1 /TAXON_ID=216777 /ORGANISM="Proboscia alata, Strain PI-D3" /LENGTH=540 /DNA_ID=CAMNT_0039233439 /DNA_START=84 /DNA_END=1703 /DNA_ORIENTATION=-
MKRSGSESSFVADEDNLPKKSYRDYSVRKSSLIGMINWSHVISTYFPHIFTFGIAVFVGLIIDQVVKEQIETVPESSGALESVRLVLTATQDLIVNVLHSILLMLHPLPDQNASTENEKPLLSFSVKVCFLCLCVLYWIAKMDNPLYLMAFSTFKSPDNWKLSHEQIMQCMKNQNTFNEASLEFMRKLLVRSGTGQSTAWPLGIVQCLDGKPMDKSILMSRTEAETVIFNIVENALAKSNLKPKDIDVLVINCSLFSPTPSLCAMVISKFGFRADIQSFNLSGMGCGASLISIDLARNMLQRQPGKALVISTEIITPNLYTGNERRFLLQNTLFRCGGAAMVLSNKWSDGRKALYKLLHLVRVQGNDQKSYNCVYEAEDENGIRGVALDKEIVKVAGKCMEKNLTTLGPLVLPLSEQIPVVITIVLRKIIKTLVKFFPDMSEKIYVKQYVPDFRRAVDHFCIHAGGRAVIDGIEKNMKLEAFHTEPSRMTLLNYGNTSSSSIWYELEYIQEHQKTNPLRKGHRIMQVAFGSGFKCTSSVW